MWRLCQLPAVLVSVALLGPVRPAPTEPSWRYSEQANWSAEFPQCGGHRQSPVDLTPAPGANQTWYPYDYSETCLTFAKGLKDGQLVAANTGRTLKVTLNGASGEPAIQLEGASPGPLNGLYILDHLHLHWNDPSGGRGSEHRMNGAFEQAEAHFVFFKQQYGNVSAALEHSDGLAVVGLLLRPNSTLVPAFPTLGMDGDLANLTAVGSTVTRQQDLRPLRPMLLAALSGFFSYPGSLTTPPCSPVVTWLVADRPVSVAAPFLQQLRTGLYANTAGNETLRNNWRELQALGSRVINKYECEEEEDEDEC